MYCEGAAQARNITQCHTSSKAASTAIPSLTHRRGKSIGGTESFAPEAARPYTQKRWSQNRSLM